MTAYEKKINIYIYICIRTHTRTPINSWLTKCIPLRLEHMKQNLFNNRIHRNNVTCSHIKTYIKRIHTTTIINTGVQTKLSELMKCTTLTINRRSFVNQSNACSHTCSIQNKYIFIHPIIDTQSPHYVSFVSHIYASLSLTVLSWWGKHTCVILLSARKIVWLVTMSS